MLKTPVILLLAFLSIMGFSYEKASVSIVNDVTRSALQQIDDCPYISYEEGQVIVKWIAEGKPIERRYSDDEFLQLKIATCEDFESKYLKFKPNLSVDNRQQFEGVSKIAILSDIHGQRDLLITLLQAHKIIDTERNWIFGEGHFVITGDVLDRGNKVMEVLWFLYKLEQQAEKAGGRVHLLLGNHEVMVFGGDLRYVSEKYLEVASIFNTTYDELFSSKTLLGQWLRTKPIAISVNNIAFAHGGFSPKFVDRRFDLETVNRLFHDAIIDHPKNTVKANDTLRFLTKSDGPIWYRGYFRDEEFTKEQAQEIVDAMDLNAIVVGHTSYDQVLKHYDGLIYSVDSSIKKGQYGELLIWQGEEFFRGTLAGDIIKF
ncbi:MAG: metallophosphoesterase [Cyclobacteriaceae bacterium]